MIIHFLYSTQHVVAGINTLMSNSDGIYPSIFCRKMEKARLMREKWMERQFISRQRRHSEVDSMNYKSTFPYLLLNLTGNKYVFRQRKGISRRNERTRSEELLLFRGVDDNIQCGWFFIFCYSKLLKLKALNKENYEEHPRSNLAQNLNVPRSQETKLFKFPKKLRVE